MSETSLFDSLDKDGDGSISREESKALLNKFLEQVPYKLFLSTFLETLS